MTLDVPIPDPPSLSGPRSRDDYDAVGNPEEDAGDDYRRDAIADALAEGAWADGFAEWAAETDLTETAFETVQRHELVDEFDFYWDPAAEDVGYRAPALPAAARNDLESTAADDFDAELDTLGRIVSEFLENDYLRRDEDTFGFFPDDEGTDEYEFRDE
jgi:hypothetical protein